MVQGLLSMSCNYSYCKVQLDILTIHKSTPGKWYWCHLAQTLALEQFKNVPCVMTMVTFKELQLSLHITFWRFWFIIPMACVFWLKVGNQRICPFVNILCVWYHRTIEVCIVTYITFNFLLTPVGQFWPPFLGVYMIE